ncbi:MAG: hypothetical protein ABEJ86_03285 [Halococcoides sp.]
MAALRLGVGVLALVVGIVMLAVPQKLLEANATITGGEAPPLDGIADYVFRAIGLVVVVIGLVMAYYSGLIA